MNLAGILTAPDLREDVVDALQEHYLPLLKNASQEDVAEAMRLAKRVVQLRATGQAEKAARVRGTIDLILENLAIELREGTKEFAEDVLEAFVSFVARLATKAVVL